MNMNRIVIASMLGALALTAHAEGWRFAPGFKEQGFRFEPTVAGTLNYVDPNDHASGTGYGVDFNFNCGLIQDPLNRIRTHVQLSHLSKSHMDVDALELSPRYTVPLSKGLSFGVGPSFAAYRLDIPGYDRTLYGIGLAGGINYRVGSLYLGADVRYHDTQSRKGENFDNLTVGFKAGVNF